MTTSNKKKSLLKAFHAAALGVSLFVTSAFSAGPAVASESIDVGATRQQPRIIEETLPTYSNVTNRGLVETVSYKALTPDQPRIDVLTDRDTQETIIVITNENRKTYRVFTTLEINGTIYPYCVDLGFDGRVHSAMTGDRGLDHSIAALRDNPPDLDRIVVCIQEAKKLAVQESFSAREGLMKRVEVPTDPRTPEQVMLLSGFETKNHITQARERVDYNRGRHKARADVVITTLFKHPALKNDMPLTFTLYGGRAPADLTGKLVGQIQEHFEKEREGAVPVGNSRNILTGCERAADSAARIMTASFESIAFERNRRDLPAEKALMKDLGDLVAFTQAATAPAVKPAVLQPVVKPAAVPPAAKPIKQPEKPAAPKNETTAKPKVGQIACLTR